jgi:Stress responsive A/B Barrel Domain
MIRHVVIWRLKQEAKRDGKIANLEPIRQVLERLRANIVGLRRLDLQPNQQPGDDADAADLLLYAEFDTWQRLHEYEAHPLHADLRKLIAPLRIERRVINYEM